MVYGFTDVPLISYCLIGCGLIRIPFTEYPLVANALIHDLLTDQRLMN